MVQLHYAKTAISQACSLTKLCRFRMTSMAAPLWLTMSQAINQ